MTTYDSLRSLPLHIDGYYLEPLEREVARGFTLRRTVIVLHGRGEEGRGEEVDYDPMQQTRFQEHGGEMPLAGEHTLESFSLLQSGQTEYRRWALESAALDLALRQSGQSLGRGDRASAATASLRRLDARRERSALARALSRASLQARPGHRLDGRDRGIAGRDGRVETVDFKGIFRGEFGAPPDPSLYGRIVDGLPRGLGRGSRAHAGDLCDPRRAPRPHHLGRRDPRVDRRRGIAVRPAAR